MFSIKEVFKVGHGPSSSHTIAPMRACKYVLNKHKSSYLKNWDNIKVRLYGSLGITGTGHLTDKAIYEALEGYKVSILFYNYLPKRFSHPNTMTVSLYNGTVRVIEEVVVSIGGGTFEVIGDLTNPPVYPFKNFTEMKKYLKDNQMTFLDLFYKFESKKVVDDLFDEMENAFLKTIDVGLKNTKDIWQDGCVFPSRAKKIYDSQIKNENKCQRKIRLISAYAYATMEQSDNYGLVVTAPTCGSCGLLPSVWKYMLEEYKLTKEQRNNAFAAAAAIGLIFKENGSVAGAMGGCQAEVGVATSMTAAMTAAALFNADVDLIEKVAIMAFHNLIGLTCDPVKGCVFVPCIQRNAIYALSGFDTAVKICTSLKNEITSFFSLDDIVALAYENGSHIDDEFRETGIGGLGRYCKYTSPTPEELKQILKERKETERDYSLFTGKKQNSDMETKEKEPFKVKQNF